MPIDTTSPAPADELNASGVYEPTEAEMDAFNHFDPIRDVPSNATVVGDVRLPEPQLGSFSPADRQLIRDRAGSNSPDAIKNAMHSLLLDRKRSHLIAAGPGESATQTQRVHLNQARRASDLKAQIDKIDAELAEVVGHETRIDENGKPQPIAIPLLHGERRKGWQDRRQLLVHEMALIAGVQGQREIREANRADAMAAYAARAQIAEHQEVNRRAVEMAREARLNAQAATRAKFLGSTNI